MGRLSRQHFVHDGPERVDVAPRIELPLASGLLGAHVLRRAHGDAGLGESLARDCAHRQRDAEVGHDRGALP